MTSASSVLELESRISTLRENCAVKREQLSDIESMHKDYEEKLAKCSREVDALNNSIKGLEIKIASRTKKRDELKTTADSLMLDAQEKARRAKILEDLSANYEGFYNSVKVIMKEAKKGTVSGICGPVSKLIGVESKYSTAIEAALSNAIQNIITDTESNAKQAINFLKNNKGGRATFLPVNTILRDLL